MHEYTTLSKTLKESGVRGVVRLLLDLTISHPLLRKNREFLARHVIQPATMRHLRHQDWFIYPISGYFYPGHIGMSRLHIKLKSRRHTAVGILIHEIAHQLLGHSASDFTRRPVSPYYDPDEGGPSRETWKLLNEIEADIVTEECLRTLGFEEEANLRKRRIEAHFLIDQTRTFEEIIPRVRGVGPLMRVVGRRVLPDCKYIRQKNPLLAQASTTILAAAHTGQLQLS